METEDNRHSSARVSGQETCKLNGNRYSVECSVSYTSNSAETHKTMNDETVVMIRDCGYCCINFYKVFSIISAHVICKQCHGNIQFSNTAPRGLGFKLLLECSCGTKSINSCRVIDKAYEINRRIVLAMRMLGIGWKGLNMFCGIMDLGSSISKTLYHGCLHNIYIATKIMYDKVIARAIEEEKQSNIAKQNKPFELTVSGDWTWRKRGFSSSFGVATITGQYSKKVLDVEIKSSFCQECNTWKDKLNTEEFHIWIEKHEKKCTNHADSVRNMKIDAVKEMFLRSEGKHGVRYATYVSDRDNGTFKAISRVKPYGNETTITTKECVNNVTKRMGIRLRNVRKSNKNITENGEGRLTGDVVCHLIKCYGWAIERNLGSAQDMKQAIWATYYHKSSSDKNPQHQFCPPGADSWCKWRKAEAEGKVDTYRHEKPPLNEDVLSVIKPIYEDFTNDNLLVSCLGADTQNNNESLNSLIWSFASEHIHSGRGCIEIATYLAVCLFNESYYSILTIMSTMGVAIGQGTLSFFNEFDADRLDRSTQYNFWEQEEGALYNLRMED